MAPRKREFPPEKIAQAREMYEKTSVPIHDIAAFLGIARNTLHNRINEWGWVKRRYDAPVQPDHRLPVRPAPDDAQSAPPRGSGEDDAVVEARSRRNERSMASGTDSAPIAAPPRSALEQVASDPGVIAERTALALNLQSAVERELAAIDRVLATLGRADSLNPERAARVLASLARTLREIVTLTTAKKPAPDPDDADDDDMPRDLDEFRRELARRMDAFASARIGRGIHPQPEADPDR